MTPIPLPTVLFVGSEMAGIARAGGLGDVVHDLARSLHESGTGVAVLLPGYSESKELGKSILTFKTGFGGKKYRTELLRQEFHGLPVYQIRSRAFFERKNGGLYIDSGRLGRGPFEDDARRFAFFSAAAAAVLQEADDFREVSVLHLHDWHTGPLAALLKMDPALRATAERLRVLFTIHNLAYQGVRPFEYGKRKDLLSFQSWFPELYSALVGTPRFFDLRDPKAEFPCFNPIKTGIRLADLVTTVSPTYAHEVTLPDDFGNRFIGGHGLERDLILLARQGRLTGILNGIDYNVHKPENRTPSFSLAKKNPAQGKRKFKHTLLDRIKTLMDADGIPRDLSLWKKKPLGVFVSRAVDQKAGILFEPHSQDGTVLDAVLKRDLNIIVLASGELEDHFSVSLKRDNALFLNRFDPELAEDLYAGGDFLLLPSYFEPCGISQLIAMRYGTLPLVHEIGGLHDTVKNGKTGFSYRGTDLEAQKKALLRALDRLIAVYTDNPDEWSAMMHQAGNQRFTWDEPVRIYRQLYSQLLGRPIGN